ncbi:MAG: hypothetical protein MUF47_12665 [Porphyrobacter sp.]|nr:hypothetical protein [Porphyrobacter sp.]
MLKVFSLLGGISRRAYAILAPSLLLSQHLAVALAFRFEGVRIEPDTLFWFLPLRRLSALPGMSPWFTALAFTLSLAVAWGLALLSYRRACAATVGYVPAALAVVPGFQIAAVALLIVAPARSAGDDLPDRNAEAAANMIHVLQGLFAGMAILVFAVLVSAVTLGAYGWGLFVLTPFLVGLAAAYLANRDVALPPARSRRIVLLSGALGVGALLMFALEGLVCILLVVPLGAAAALAGGALGRRLAAEGHARGRPLLSVAVLPLMFAVEAAVPPAMMITTFESIDIAAPPAVVWHVLISRDQIGPPPKLLAMAGFAFPIRGTLLGEGVGAVRIGEFSTGIAHERVTAWEPRRKLAFTVVDQPAMMEEMSPYRRVHAPHLHGYFETRDTGFDLRRRPGNATRLTIRSSHVMRLDPVLYWEPMARWAIHQNVSRVLKSVKDKAEHVSPSPSGTTTAD